MAQGKPLKDNKDEVITMLAQGVDQTIIASKFDVTCGAVSKYKKSHIVEVYEQAGAFLHEAAGLSGFLLVDILRTLQETLNRADADLSLKDAMMLIRELRATAETIVKKAGDVNILNVGELTIEQMAGKLAEIHTPDELDAIIRERKSFESIGDNGT